MDGPWKVKLAAIERELEGALPAEVQPRWLRRQAGSALEGADRRSLGGVLSPGRELLGRGGKRWRPLLLLACAEMFGCPWRRALPLTPLVEVPHNGSLIVDDVEDSSPQRRGQAAIHVLFGLDAALNTGNLMYFLPAEAVERSGLEPARQLAILRLYLQNMVRLHLGQGLDILWHREHESIPGEQEYLQMCRLKTGSLSRLAAQVGAIAAGAQEAQTDGLGDIAEQFGACFQVMDDVNNLSTGVPGKMRGDDIVEGKKSLPIILHLQRCPEDHRRVRDCFLAAAAGPDQAAEAIRELVGLLERSGSLAESHRRAGALFARARQALRDGFPDSAARARLLGLVDALTGLG